jgi:hypothetical protein
VLPRCKFYHQFPKKKSHLLPTYFVTSRFASVPLRRDPGTACDLYPSSPLSISKAYLGGEYDIRLVSLFSVTERKVTIMPSLLFSALSSPAFPHRWWRWEDSSCSVLVTVVYVMAQNVSRKCAERRAGPELTFTRIFSRGPSCRNVRALYQ